MVAKQFITCQLGIWTLFALQVLMWLNVVSAKTPDTIWLSRVTACFAPFAVVLGDQEIIILVYLSLRRSCHSQISAGTREVGVEAVHFKGCDPSV